MAEELRVVFEKSADLKEDPAIQALMDRMQRLKDSLGMPTAAPVKVEVVNPTVERIQPLSKPTPTPEPTRPSAETVPAKPPETYVTPETFTAPQLGLSSWNPEDFDEQGRQQHHQYDFGTYSDIRTRAISTKAQRNRTADFLHRVAPDRYSLPEETTEYTPKEPDVIHGPDERVEQVWDEEQNKKNYEHTEQVLKEDEEARREKEKQDKEDEKERRRIERERIEDQIAEETDIANLVSATSSGATSIASLGVQTAFVSMLGPIIGGAVGVAVTDTLVKTFDTLQRSVQAVIGKMDELVETGAKYNGRIAAIQSESEVIRMLVDMQNAERYEDRIAKYAVAKSSLELEIHELRTQLLAMFGPAITDAMSLLTALVRGWNIIADKLPDTIQLEAIISAAIGAFVPAQFAAFIPNFVQYVKLVQHQLEFERQQRAQGLQQIVEKLINPNIQFNQLFGQGGGPQFIPPPQPQGVF